jgi:ElaB/YqjD/DUF883 family membrane-anchored ribosome-binding protein
MTDDNKDRRDNRRRAEDAMAFQLMTETRQMVKEIEQVMEAKLDSMTSELHMHRRQSEDRHEEISKRIEAISQSTVNALAEQSRLIKELTKTVHHAFPNGDAEAHCAAHEDWIKKKKDDDEFWLDIKKKAVGSVVTAVLLWVGIVLWTAFVQGPK